MAKSIKGSSLRGKTAVMCVRVPYTLKRGIVLNEIWGIILRSGKFSNKARTPLGRVVIEVDFYIKTTRQKRNFLMVTTKGKDEMMFTFICHPRHEPLFEALKKFFERYELKCEVLGGEPERRLDHAIPA